MHDDGDDVISMMMARQKQIITSDTARVRACDEGNAVMHVCRTSHTEKTPASFVFPSFFSFRFISNTVWVFLLLLSLFCTEFVFGGFGMF